MSKGLRFDFEWESPGAARGEELRATWARLRIHIDERTVTRVEDLVARSVREALYLPLYPLAEWLAANWWPLLYEVPSSRSRSMHRFSQRHNLAAASEGYALPELLIRPEGERVVLHWSTAERTVSRVRFLDQGLAEVRRDALQRSLDEFIEAVVLRLDDSGVPDTPLATEWRAIKEADLDERAFCRLAGMLGWDPYDLDERDARTIISTAELLPPEIVDEYFASAQGGELLTQAEVVKRFLSGAAPEANGFGRLQQIKPDLSISEWDATPWTVGYEAARSLRKLLHLDERPVASATDLAAALDLSPDVWSRSSRLDLTSLNAVVASAAGYPRFGFRSRGRAPSTFTACRALFEYLTVPGDGAALVSSSQSVRQKRNRAFAAEFMLPAAYLRGRITSPMLSEDEVQELAEDLEAPEAVVRHQIQNHRLAEVIDWTA